MRPEPLLFLVTGGRGAGKTSFCASLVAAAQEAGWRPAGLISRPVFEGARRTAIDVENIASQEVRRLAVYSEQDPTPGSLFWKFDRDVIAWGNALLAGCTPCDLLVVDELGPLEFEREAGWQAGLAAVDSHDYVVALVVVRSELLGEALLRWPDANLVEIDLPEESARKASILAEQLF